MTTDDWKHIKEATLAEDSEAVWAYKQELADLIDAEIARQTTGGWIPVSERLPEHEQTVLMVVQTYSLYFKKILRHVIRGCRIEEGKLEVSPMDDWPDSTYDEERDAFFANEAWYEEIQFNDEYRYGVIDNDWTVTHWLPLPKPPESEA